MDNIIFATYRRPNEALAWKSWVRDYIGRVPLLPGVCESAIVAGTKCDDGEWQIGGGINFVETRGILQHLAILCRKPCDICAAEALNRESEE